jgi:two-component system CheB/CheR fusion protein
VRLVDDLLDVSRIITGKIHLEKEPVTIDSFLDRAIEEIQPLIDERGHELMVSRPARPIFVEGDVVRLSQVVSNLLGNAAKYTDKPSQIWLSIESEDENFAIKVRDKGIGMTPDELSRIFNLFEQGDTSLSRSRGGLGIGLTLVKRIVALHGGTVTATSDGPALGSEFTVRLPLAASYRSSTNNDATIKHAASENSRRRILVVDDNVDAAISVERLLKHWGHIVACAFNGPDAIEKAKTFHPQFVLLDIGMPEMSGYEVAEQLRANPEFQGLVITALTGYGQAEDRRRSLAAGFNFHLIKPPNPAELEALISSPSTYTSRLEH